MNKIGTVSIVGALSVGAAFFISGSIGTTSAEKKILLTWECEPMPFKVGFVVEASTNLHDWLVVTNTGTNKSCILPAMNPQEFFRVYSYRIYGI